MLAVFGREGGGGVSEWEVRRGGLESRDTPVWGGGGENHWVPGLGDGMVGLAAMNEVGNQARGDWRCLEGG